MTPQPVVMPAQRTALDELVAQRAAQPFAWGVRDCAMWAFDAVHAATGRDPAPDLRGAYSTPRAALRLLRRLGGLHGIATARMGAPVPLPAAPDGAVVLLHASVCGGESAAHGALAVVWRGLVLAQGDKGLVMVRPAAVQACWRSA